MNWHEKDRPEERVWQAIARRLPKGLVYWAAVRMFASAHRDPRYQVRIDALDIPATDAFALWGAAEQ